MDQLDLYAKASEWTLGKVTAAAPLLDLPTPCDDWDVRSLMNHMLATQQYFVASARGEQATPPGRIPPDLLSADPAADFAAAREETLRVFGEDGVIERTGPAIGIAFGDQLLHGWDLATAIGQSGVMPEELAQAAYDVVHGAFTDDQRQGVFAPEIAVGPDASAQERLLAYTGRDPG
ncbi:MAG TPA: TIGR03086 family metal-binding protein [Marmoricola sp.]|nr:TIGR03086 family metal-binding protein [Marmoricola sp.]